MKRYKPLIDRTYVTMMIIIFVILTVMTVIAAFSPVALLIVVPIYLLVVYHLISPFFGYVELRENSLYVRYGLFMKKEIPYSKIRASQKDADSTRNPCFRSKLRLNTSTSNTTPLI